MRYSKYSGCGNFFSLPNEVFLLGLSAGELSVYSFLKRCENRKTHQWSKQKSVCGISVVKREIAAVFHCGDFHFGGPNRDRTDDLTDAKSHLNIFRMISNYLLRFPLRFAFFPPLFRTQISMWCAAVCGGSCGQKRSQPFAGNDFSAWTGSVFHASDCLHCNSEDRIKQVISALSTAQDLRGSKQKMPFPPSR